MSFRVGHGQKTKNLSGDKLSLYGDVENIT